MEVRYLIRCFQHFPQRGSIAVDRQTIFKGFVECYSARQRPCDDRFRQRPGFLRPEKGRKPPQP